MNASVARFRLTYLRGLSQLYATVHVQSSAVVHERFTTTTTPPSRCRIVDGWEYPRKRKLQLPIFLLQYNDTTNSLPRLQSQADYELGSFFSLEALEAEIKSDEVVAVVPMPGWLLAKGVQETHAGDPVSGWMQYDESVKEDTGVDPPVVTHVTGHPLEENRVYRVATKVSDLTNGQSPSWTAFYRENPTQLPPKGAYVNIHAELMGYFSRNLFRKLWDAISQELEEECSVDEACHADERLAVLDVSGDGVVTVSEIQVALKEKLGYSVDERETSLAEFVHSYADTTGDGQVTVKDIQTFCQEMEDLYESDKWRLSHPKSETASEKEPVRAVE